MKVPSPLPSYTLQATGLLKPTVMFGKIKRKNK